MDQPSTSDSSRLLTAGQNTYDILVRDESTFFKPLRTIPLAVLQIILNAALFAESIFYLCFADYCKNQTTPVPIVNKTVVSHRNDGLLILSERDCGSIVIYSIALVWMLTWALSFAFRIVHNGHRNTGYLELYARTKYITAIPLITLSIGCFLLLVAVTLRQDHLIFTGKRILGEPWFWLFLQILTGIELIVIIIALLVYIVQVAKFNRLQPVPDVFSIASMPNARSAVEIGPGIIEPDKEIDLLQSVCERQGKLITYLRRRCDVLGVTLNQLTASDS